MQKLFTKHIFTFLKDSWTQFVQQGNCKNHEKSTTTSKRADGNRDCRGICFINCRSKFWFKTLLGHWGGGGGGGFRAFAFTRLWSTTLGHISRIGELGQWPVYSLPDTGLISCRQKGTTCTNNGCILSTIDAQVIWSQWMTSQVLVVLTHSFWRTSMHERLTSCFCTAPLELIFSTSSSLPFA